MGLNTRLSLPVKKLDAFTFDAVVNLPSLSLGGKSRRFLRNTLLEIV